MSDLVGACAALVRRKTFEFEMILLRDQQKSLKPTKSFSCTTISCSLQRPVDRKFVVGTFYFILSS